MVSFEGLMINNNFIYLSSSLCIRLVFSVILFKNEHKNYEHKKRSVILN